MVAELQRYLAEGIFVIDEEKFVVGFERIVETVGTVEVSVVQVKGVVFGRLQGKGG